MGDIKVTPIPPAYVAARPYFDYEMYDSEVVDPFTAPGSTTFFFRNFSYFAQPEWLGPNKIFGHHTNCTGSTFLPCGYHMKPKSIVVDGFPPEKWSGVKHEDLPKWGVRIAASDPRTNWVPDEISQLEQFEVVLPPIRNLKCSFLAYARVKGTLLRAIYG